MVACWIIFVTLIVLIPVGFGYDKVSSRYIATIKVYQEWVNLEK